MNAKKVIIDCDPGIDDALALMLKTVSANLITLKLLIKSWMKVVWSFLPTH